MAWMPMDHNTNLYALVHPHAIADDNFLVFSLIDGTLDQSDEMTQK